MHLAEWEREVANVCIHGMTREAPIARFARDEAHRLKPLGGQPSFGSLRELARFVGNDCAVEIDTNSYSVPWQLIGERVAVIVTAGEVRIAIACRGCGPQETGGAPAAGRRFLPPRLGRRSQWRGLPTGNRGG